MKAEQLFHTIFTTDQGSVTFYKQMARSKRFAELVSQEAMQEGLTDDFGHPMTSFMVLSDEEYKSLPKNFLRKFELA